MQEEVDEAENFMRRHPITHENRGQMLEKFGMTTRSRIKLIEDRSKDAKFIVKKYPLLVEMLEAVC